MQFVTFRLADSLPQSKLHAWREERNTWMEIHPEPWSVAQEAEYHRKFTARIDHWLDQGYGGCLLKDSANRQIVEDVVMRFQDERVRHESWIIMPNHAHLPQSRSRLGKHMGVDWDPIDKGQCVGSQD